MSQYYYKNEQSDKEDDDYGGVHTNSGVPNFAFYKVAMALGGYSWQHAGQIWYAALTDKRLQREPDTPYDQQPKFVDFAKLTVEHAEALYKADSFIAGVVRKAWKEVGVL